MTATLRPGDHGHIATYRWRGCKCRECRAAGAARNRHRVGPSFSEWQPKPPGRSLKRDTDVWPGRP